MPTRTFIFAGGGTGGHLFPGVAIARELERLFAADNAVCRSLFVCSDRPLDARILEAERVEFIALGARPFGIRPAALVRFLRSWGRSVRESRVLIRSEIERAGERAAVRVVAMGGFVAAPVVQAARVERVGVTLVNLDAIPGKANRLIARRADPIFTAARLVHPLPNWTEVPPIVRAGACAAGSKTACRARLGLDPDRSTLLVTGGSQGAQSINRLMLALIEQHPALLAGTTRSGEVRWQVLHQCGNDGERDLAAAYDRAGIRAIVRPLVAEMGDWWGAADLCVSRCGAGSVGEAWANRVPTVLLPYPYHRDQHQKHNAAPLVQAGAARLVEDQIDPRATLPAFERAIGPLLSGTVELAAMTERTASLGPADGATRIAAALWHA